MTFAFFRQRRNTTGSTYLGEVENILFLKISDPHLSFGLKAAKFKYKETLAISAWENTSRSGWNTKQYSRLTSGPNVLSVHWQGQPRAPEGVKAFSWCTNEDQHCALTGSGKLFTSQLPFKLERPGFELGTKCSFHWARTYCPKGTPTPIGHQEAPTLEILYLWCMRQRNMAKFSPPLWKVYYLSLKRTLKLAIHKGKIKQQWSPEEPRRPYCQVPVLDAWSFT